MIKPKAKKTNKSHRLTVMSWNLYLGVDFRLIFEYPYKQIPQLVTEAYLQFLSTNYMLRAKAIAKQIQQYGPDIIGLQEAVRWSFIPPNSPEIVYDYIERLLDELKKLGLYYQIVQVNTNLTLTFPSDVGAQVSFADRGALLVNQRSGLTVLGTQSGAYQRNQLYPFEGETIGFLRGWTAADFAYKGKAFRVITTHLEAFSEEVQLAQLNELLAGPANTDLPLLLIGDLNSDANTGGIVYIALLAANFTDPWLVGGEGEGSTCCQAGNLLNVYSSLSKRLDLVLIKNAPSWRIWASRTVGTQVTDKTPTAQWPSDHCGVVTGFLLP